MSQHQTGPGDRARRIQSAWALRALIVAAILSGLVVAALLVLQPKPSSTAPPRPSVSPRASHSFWMNVDPAQLEATIKATSAAFNVYLKRDQAEAKVNGIAFEFAQIQSEADLIRTFQMFATASGDDYIGLLTNEQYYDRMARMSGAVIGVDADVAWDPTAKAYKITRVGATAEAQGLKAGEEIIEITGLKIPKDVPNVWQIAQAVKQIMGQGTLGSACDMKVIRDGKEELIPVKRAVVSQVVPFEIGPALHPMSNQPQDNVKTLTFHHLRGTTLLNDLYQQLQSMQQKGVTGLVVDLREIGEADAETSVRIAAMFLGKGTLGRFISTTPEGGLVMKSYEIASGKVQVKTQGPYAVGADGTLVEKAQAPDAIEVKDWPCDVFKGQVVAVVGRQTAGSGEAIASAFSHAWRQDQSRTQTVAKFYSAGKGTGQTYFPIGEKYWLRLSTSFCLQPEGKAIEGELGPGPNVAVPQNQDENWYARYTLFVRMSVLPKSDFPADRQE